jgi:hypothetical protein
MKTIGMPPAVQIVGEISHADFRDAANLLRAQGRLVTAGGEPPELVVLAQSRPGAIAARRVEALRRRAPLAGFVALVGSWCEGEARTGRPWPGALRLYWYEFPGWWRRQLTLRDAGFCPDWARPINAGFQNSAVTVGTGELGNSRSPPGVIIVRTPHRDTADALASVFHRSRYATVWEPPGRSSPIVRGATVGIWDGGQLRDDEAVELAAFCRRMAKGGAPVVALSDFPRRDCVQRAMEAGAGIVLGKPWLNADLVDAIQFAVLGRQAARAA